MRPAACRLRKAFWQYTRCKQLRPSRGPYLQHSQRAIPVRLAYAATSRTVATTVATA